MEHCIRAVGGGHIAAFTLLCCARWLDVVGLKVGSVMRLHHAVGSRCATYICVVSFLGRVCSLVLQELFALHASACVHALLPAPVCRGATAAARAPAVSQSHSQCAKMRGLAGGANPVATIAGHPCSPHHLTCCGCLCVLRLCCALVVKDYSLTFLNRRHLNTKKGCWPTRAPRRPMLCVSPSWLQHDSFHAHANILLLC